MEEAELIDLVYATFSAAPLPESRGRSRTRVAEHGRRPRARLHREGNDMSIFDSWLLGGALALVLMVILGYFLPRFSAYFLGPALLAVGGVSFITLNKYFFPFQSDGSIAGLIVPGIMWLGLVTCCVLGCVLIVTGRSRVKSAASPEADHANTPTTD
jgi:ABC-type branched-subunit amino acid transport system permease subunit